MFGEVVQFGNEAADASATTEGRRWEDKNDLPGNLPGGFTSVFLAARCGDKLVRFTMRFYDLEDGNFVIEFDGHMPGFPPEDIGSIRIAMHHLKRELKLTSLGRYTPGQEQTQSHTP